MPFLPLADEVHGGHRVSRSSKLGTVYLLHFSKPVGHAQHYLGWAVHVDARVKAHLVAVALQRGAVVDLVKAWPNVTRAFERHLKDLGTFRRICPVCLDSYNAKCAARMRRLRSARRSCGSPSL